MGRFAFLVIGVHFLFSDVNASTSLNSSVLMFSEWDLARCSEQVAKAHRLGNRMVNFVPTLHFVVDSQFQMKEYCFRSNSGGCTPFNEDALTRLKGYYAQCFKTALEYQLKISVLPHLDPHGTHLWRNDLEFDPLKIYQGYTYEQIMIHPLIEAMREVLPDSYPVELSLQGEMGKTLLKFATSYSEILSVVKDKLSKFQAKVGISVNFNKVGGSKASSTLEERRSLEILIAQTDFLGLSAYQGQSLPIHPSHFSKNIESVENELSKMEIRIPPGKEFHFSEVSIGGGGLANDGKTKAANPEEAARAPWAGITGPYSADRDPWQNPALRELRFRFYKALSIYLKNPGPHNVTTANLWNVNSWDPQGMFSGFYRDEQIIDLIRSHNAE